MSAYPQQWERFATHPGGLRVLLRPLKPSDEALYPEFSNHVTPEDARLRFFHPITQPTPAMVRQFVDIDYDRAMAFVAISRTPASCSASRAGCDQFRTHGEYGDRALGPEAPRARRQLMQCSSTGLAKRARARALAGVLL